ncbi:hypothetical protein E1B28_013465 [Marasmius oreades]|uniref:Uncharacterized protein n=1 Tax=Marasmius oreades TaxID=181124 RepID=A0A9P7RPV7_9AGAR|nr:uncharacterized protein E1B28_013465 [Marasmius oreades]KAG7087504.1 hypothetical protein E1B28_013465 [Marasmius oreades]
MSVYSHHSLSPVDRCSGVTLIGSTSHSPQSIPQTYTFTEHNPSSGTTVIKTTVEEANGWVVTMTVKIQRIHPDSPSFPLAGYHGAWTADTDMQFGISMDTDGIESNPVDGDIVSLSSAMSSVSTTDMDTPAPSPPPEIPSSAVHSTYLHCYPGSNLGNCTFGINSNCLPGAFQLS